MARIETQDMLKIKEISTNLNRIENIQCYLEEIKKYKKDNNFITLKLNFNNNILHFPYPLCVDTLRFSSFCEKEIDLYTENLIHFGINVDVFKPRKGKEYE